MSDFPYVPPPQPFWFASSELAADLLHAEIVTINKVIEQHPELPSLFDAPEATASQRKLCFTLLAHRTVLEIVDELFAGRSEQPPSFGEEQSNALRSTNGLVTNDAPDWALAISRVVDALPYHFFNALPGPLRVGGFNRDNAEQMQAIQSAKETLITVDQIQALIERVLDQQLQRLSQRWSAGITRVRRPNKRRGWEKREKLYEAIRTALKANPSLQGMALCAELDKRHAPPLFDWMKSEEWREGLTWKEAWKIPNLKRKIRRVRQEAMKNR